MSSYLNLLRPVRRAGGVKMKIATIAQHENGLYTSEIRDEYGDVESAIIAATPTEVYRWAVDHNADELALEA